MACCGIERPRVSGASLPPGPVRSLERNGYEITIMRRGTATVAGPAPQQRRPSAPDPAEHGVPTAARSGGHHHLHAAAAEEGGERKPEHRAEGPAEVRGVGEARIVAR